MRKSIIVLIILHFAGNFALLFSINSDDAQKIGWLIWQNEASGRTDLLVFWNPYESFPSLGYRTLHLVS